MRYDLRSQQENLQKSMIRTKPIKKKKVEDKVNSLSEVYRFGHNNRWKIKYLIVLSSVNIKSLDKGLSFYLISNFYLIIYGRCYLTSFCHCILFYLWCFICHIFCNMDSLFWGSTCKDSRSVCGCAWVCMHTWMHMVSFITVFFPRGNYRSLMYFIHFSQPQRETGRRKAQSLSWKQLSWF